MTTSSRMLAGRAVGPVGLGCMGMTWAYGTSPDADDPVAVIHHALDVGATLIDTADVYGPFTNEELVGRALAGRRDEAFLASKCGLTADTLPQLTPDGRPEHVRAAAEASLRRLGVDHVDLYQLHRVDPKVPLADTWGAMAELVRRGMTPAIGMSEVTVEQLDEAHAIHPVSSVQSELSLWSRDPLTNGVLDWCDAHDVTFIGFSPLGRGFLTGALTGRTFDRGDVRTRMARFQPEAMAQNQALLDAVQAVADRHGATKGQVALAWDLARSPRVVLIPGTRRISRLDENVAAGDLELTGQDRAELDAVPLPAQARYEYVDA